MARTGSLLFLYNSCCIISTSIPETTLTLASVQIFQLSRTCSSTGHLYLRNHTSKLYASGGLQPIKHHLDKNIETMANNKKRQFRYQYELSKNVLT